MYFNSFKNVCGYFSNIYAIIIIISYTNVLFMYTKKVKVTFGLTKRKIKPSFLCESELTSSFFISPQQGVSQQKHCITNNNS